MALTAALLYENTPAWQSVKLCIKPQKESCIVTIGKEHFQENRNSWQAYICPPVTKGLQLQ